MCSSLSQGLADALRFSDSELFSFRVFSQDIPTDVVVAVGEAHFSLHKV